MNKDWKDIYASLPQTEVKAELTTVEDEVQQGVYTSQEGIPVLVEVSGKKWVFGRFMVYIKAILPSGIIAENPTIRIEEKKIKYL